MASYIGSLGETLRLMKFMIKTVYGTSQGYYQSTDQEKLAGTGGQGRRSGASPALWLSLFIVLLILVLAYKRNDPIRPEEYEVGQPGTIVCCKNIYSGRDASLTTIEYKSAEKVQNRWGCYPMVSQEQAYAVKIYIQEETQV